jgi:hypothetical protein
MMGVLNFAHASFYMLSALFRLPDQPDDRLLGGFLHRPGTGWLHRCVSPLAIRNSSMP